MLKSILEYWPLILALISAFGSVISFYFYVKWRFKMFNRDLTLYVDQNKIDREESKKDREELVKKLEAQKQAADAERKEVKQKLDTYSDKQHSLEVVMAEINVKLDFIPKSLSTMEKTVEEAFTQIKEMKKEFVSVQQFQETLEDIRQMRKDLKSKGY